jgi:plasmid stability protein
MRDHVTSSIMPRTTVNLDASVLRALKRRAADEGKSLGDLISQILAPELSRGKVRREPRRFRWGTARMEPRVDLEDKEALRRALGNP